MSFSTIGNSFLQTDHLRSAGQATTAFLALYSSTFVLVLKCKRTALQNARAAGKRFDRYNSPEMHVVDRLQGNFLEWSPIFLGLLWTLAANGALSGPALAAVWGYVTLRALYVVLILKNGLKDNGMNKPLWISTFPAYGCLSVMFAKAVAVLFF